ncbi:MAG: copper resistance protein CopC [Ilumatobacteraceae bacterium]
MQPTSTSPVARVLRAVLAAVAGLFVALFLGTATAAAANSLNSSTPADGSTVTASPASIEMKFNEALGQQNTIVVTCGGATVATGAAQVGSDLLTLTVPLPTALPKGSCAVAWKVSNQDGTPGGDGSFKFTVATDTATTTATATATTEATTAAGGTTATGAASTGSGSAASTGSSSSGAGVGDGVLGVVRLFSTLSIAILLGSFVLIAMAWPEGVEYILTVRFLRITYYVAVASTVLFVICLTSQVTGQGFGSSISPAEWKHLTDTGPGVAALFRLVFTIACVYVTMRPERLIDPTTHLASMAIPTLAVASMGFDRPLGELAALGALAGIAHAIGMAVWFGGLVLLARVVLAGPGESDLIHAVRGFGKISTPAIVVTVVSGLIQTWRLDRSGLFSTGHGYVMLLKTVAVALMIFVGLAARQFVTERLSRVEVMNAPTATRLRRAFGFEAGIGVVVLILSSWLLALTPAHAGTTASPSEKDLGPAQLIHNAANGVDVQVRFTQVVGPNAVRVDVLQAPEGFSGLQVVFTPPEESGVVGVALDVPLTCECAAELPKATGIPIGAPGTWTITVKINDVEMGSKNVVVASATDATTTSTG